VDLVIEAVFEDGSLKSKVTMTAEAHISETTVFATNTSTLPITDLSKASKNRKNFIGIHFFSPVNKMNLVEIIRGKETEDIAVAKALDFVKQIKKNAHSCQRCKVFLCQSLHNTLFKRRCENGW
jgi:3-hydroxyacyl-CoA dehydrogenase/enoyl-CoA hydratase/3-hydroxybutyryl-CoA epimerase